MNICKKIDIQLNRNLLICFNGMDKHNSNGPAKIQYRIYNNELQIESVSYFINNQYSNKKGPSIILLTNNKIFESYWDYSNTMVYKLYHIDGSVKHVSIRKNRRNYKRDYPFGMVRDNIVKEYNKIIPKIEALFKMAGKDYKINEVL